MREYLEVSVTVYSLFGQGKCSVKKECDGRNEVMSSSLITFLGQRFHRKTFYPNHKNPESVKFSLSKFILVPFLVLNL